MNKPTALSPPAGCEVYTDANLAAAIASALEPKASQVWLEPSSGGGAFLVALHQNGVPKDRIRGVELRSSVSPKGFKACVREAVNFFDYHPRKKFDGIIGNPPYAPIERVEEHWISTVLEAEDPFTEGPIRKGANLWYAFLCRSLNLLKEGGRIGFVLPASWEFADYASAARKVLPTRFSRTCIIRSKKPLFEGVLEGCIILLAWGYCEKSSGAISRYEVADKQSTIELLQSLHGASSEAAFGCSVAEAEVSVPLGELLSVQIGAVTGDSCFFLLSETERTELGLPEEAMHPIVTKAKHISSPWLTQADWLTLKQSSERIWLFRPTGKLLKNRHVQDYLQRTSAEGGCNRTAYKVRNRNPWHLVSLPMRVDGFLSGLTSRSPHICLCRMTRLNASNTLYVVSFRSSQRLVKKLAIATSFLSSRVREQLEKSVRLYASGLQKLEPSDITSLSIPVSIRDVEVSPEDYKKVVDLHLIGKAEKSSQLADTILGW